MRKQEGFFYSERNNLSQYDKRRIMDYSFLQMRYWGCHFFGGGMEKGLIITARYLGLEISASEVIEIKITGKQTATPLGEVFSIEI